MNESYHKLGRIAIIHDDYPVIFFQIWHSVTKWLSFTSWHNHW